MLGLKPWNGFVEGNMALCPDGKYVIMGDYDNMGIETIKYELKAMQSAYGLGDFHVIESSPGKYHVICFDKVSWARLQEILQQLRIDPAYAQSRTIILRTSPKSGHEPRCVLTMQGNLNANESSKAHMSHYVNHVKNMPVDRLKLYNHDNNDLLQEVRYST